MSKKQKRSSRARMQYRSTAKGWMAHSKSKSESFPTMERTHKSFLAKLLKGVLK